MTPSSNPLHTAVWSVAVAAVAVAAALIFFGHKTDEDIPPLFMWDLEVGEEVEMGEGVRITGVGRKPVVAAVEGMFTNSELVELGRNGRGKGGASKLRNSKGEEIDSKWRSSTSYTYRADQLADTILQKISNITKISMNHVSRATVQLVEYSSDKRNFYYPHYDSSQLVNLGKPVVDADSDYPSSGRFVTVLIYLTSVDRGGETFFPFAGMAAVPPMLPQSVWSSPNVSERFFAAHCAKRRRSGISIKPLRGLTVIFYNHRPSPTNPSLLGDLDLHSYHGGCPPTSNTKLLANFWIPIPPSNFQSPPPPTYWHPTPQDSRYAILKSFGQYLSKATPMRETIQHHAEQAGLSEDRVEALVEEFSKT